MLIKFTIRRLLKRGYHKIGRSTLRKKAREYFKPFIICIYYIVVDFSQCRKRNQAEKRDSPTLEHLTQYSTNINICINYPNSFFKLFYIFNEQQKLS